MADPTIKHRLAGHFRDQQRFADGYSPLYAALFGIIADWLLEGRAGRVADWLVAAGEGRNPFDVTLLLMAALHRDVLAGEPAAAELGNYYTTAGRWPPHGGDPADSARSGRLPDDRLPDILRSTILTRQEALAVFIRTANVQTNETGRGLAWLLPAACPGWPAVHLVELGVSAGLNLVAEQRGYRLADAADPERTILKLGDGPAQFTTLARGMAEFPPPSRFPTILTRTGGDLNPFHLRSADDECTLASFVWGDQPRRLERLGEGILALRSTAATTAPVRLLPLQLPEQLSNFLNNDLPRPLSAPVIIFNTTVTMYLPERGVTLRRRMDEWAAVQDVPVLWLQWEPPAGDDMEPPGREWLAWTADYWANNGHEPGRSLRLAWVHPHGTELVWEPGWSEFLRITMQN